jgi:hypothetical protein
MMRTNMFSVADGTNILCHENGSSIINLNDDRGFDINP